MGESFLGLLVQSRESLWEDQDPAILGHCPRTIGLIGNKGIFRRFHIFTIITDKSKFSLLALHTFTLILGKPAQCRLLEIRQLLIQKP